MSDPMTRTDIEDVLSSIRRLVSEEARPESAMRSAPVSAPPVGAPDAGRLVLTPALRVAGREDAPEPAPEQAAAPAPLPPAEAEDWLPEESAPEATVPDEGLPEDLPAEERPLTVEPVTEAPLSADRIGAKIAGLEAAVAARSEQWDPEGTEEFDVDDNHSDAFEGPVRFFHRGVSVGVRSPEIEDAAPSEEPEPADDDALRGAADFHSKRIHRPAEPEATPEAEPEDAPGPAASAKTADVWPEEKATEAAPEVEDSNDTTDAEASREDEAAATATPESDLFEEADSAFLDEESLRDVVREIIRQELQGTLGERITRNVRKLVRAEINRALASRDFE